MTQRYFGDELDALSHKVIGAAIEVHRHLGPGLLEKAYLDCLAIELAEAGIATEKEVVLPLRYKSLPNELFAHGRFCEQPSVCAIDVLSGLKIVVA